jgi:hypothetical protein
MTHSALVRWLPPEMRAGAGLPTSLRYVGVSRFPEDGDAWPDGAWSIELRFHQPPAESGNNDITEARVRFLFDEAPQERLRRGVTFSLHEGLQKVANIEVLD